ncbi:hypothetical protein ACV334_33445, partial [Pseudomonas aeruginosa]
ADIARRFAETSERNGTEALKAPLRNYRFVHHHLLDTVGNWATNAVAIYLAKAMRALDREALAMGDRAPE